MTAHHEGSLTQTMQPVIEAVGFDLAIELVALRGGTRVMVPRVPHESDALVQIIGMDAARTLLHFIGPGTFAVPRCMSWLLARRNEEICARALFGESQAELALRFRLTERHIGRIWAADGIKAPAAIDYQDDLFTTQETTA